MRTLRREALQPVMGFLRMLAPRHQATAVFRLSPEVLRRWRIDALMLDLDNTLVEWGESSPPQAVLAWLAELRRAGIPACVVSNTLSRRAVHVSAVLGLPAAQGRFKPSARKLREALRMLGTPSARTAMVGDQLFTDVLAGNRLGVPTILVAPLGAREPWRVWPVRLLERIVLGLLVRRGLAPGAPEV